MSRPLRIEYPGAFYHATLPSKSKKHGISDGQRKREISILRRIGPWAIWGRHRFGGLNLREIGEYFGMQRSAVSQLSRRFGETLKGNQGLRKVLTKIEKEDLSNVAA